MNWQEMQVARQLDRTIAERIGYTVQEYDAPFHKIASSIHVSNGKIIADPKGKLLVYTYVDYNDLRLDQDSTDEAWRKAFDPIARRIGVEYNSETPVPFYSTVTDDALMLWDQITEGYTPRLVRILHPVIGTMKPLYKASILNNETLDADEMIAGTPASAISKAFLLWLDMRESD